MKRVFISGRFSASTKEELVDNVLLAANYGYKVIQMGGVPFIPHTMFLFFLNRVGYKDILDCCIDWLFNCDAIFMLPNWEGSYGAKKEFETAIKMNIPVFTDLKELKKFIKGG